MSDTKSKWPRSEEDAVYVGLLVRVLNTVKEWGSPISPEQLYELLGSSPEILVPGPDGTGIKVDLASFDTHADPVHLLHARLTSLCEVSIRTARTAVRRHRVCEHRDMVVALTEGAFYRCGAQSFVFDPAARFYMYPEYDQVVLHGGSYHWSPTGTQASLAVTGDLLYRSRPGGRSGKVVARRLPALTVPPEDVDWSLAQFADGRRPIPFEEPAPPIVVEPERITRMAELPEVVFTPPASNGSTPSFEVLKSGTAPGDELVIKVDGVLYVATVVVATELPS